MSNEKTGKAVLSEKNIEGALFTCEDVVEGGLHVGGVQGRRLDETQVVLLRERLRLVCRHRA